VIFLEIFSRRWILASLLVAIGAGVCVRLGIWQLDRLAQRRAFNAQVQAMRGLAPLVLPAGDDLTKMEWRAVRAVGTYDFANQAVIRNQYNGDEYGFHLVTPLRLADGEAVLVDRGWIPAEGNAEPADWRRYDGPPAASISGIVRLGQTIPSFGGVPNPTLTPGQTRLDFWVYLDLGRMGQQLQYPVLPAYIQLDPDSNRTVPPIPSQPELDLSEGPHQGYALQWFSFAALLLVGYPIYVRKQEPGRG
jgi:surfeit locus 1 family protein